MPQIAMAQIVSDVERATEPMSEVTPKEAFRIIGEFEPETCSQYHGTFVATHFHPCIATIHFAFSSHRPLVLTPDIFWLLIMQGLAQHVNANSEELRHMFVDHKGKRELSIRRDDFVKGSPENPWNEAVAEFSDQIRALIGEANYARIMAHFSTTGPVEKTVFEMTLMNVMKSYIDLTMHTLCGIPEVILEGTAEDWQTLPGRAAAIGEAYDLDWWTNLIVPILERIARNAAGADDPELWKNIYKMNSMSGGPYVTGWITDFVPYVEVVRDVHIATGKVMEKMQDYPDYPGDSGKYRQVRLLKRNRMLGKPPSEFEGVSLDSLPNGLSRVPFAWNVLGMRHEMEFVGGFFAIEQRAENLALKPKIGWAVRDLKRS